MEFFSPFDMIFRLLIFVSTVSNEAQNTILYLINSFQDDISDTDFVISEKYYAP